MEQADPIAALISARQISLEYATKVFGLADAMQDKLLPMGRADLLRDKIIALLFYEPSSRTRLSFQTAALRLGAGVITSADRQSASLAKGESIQDTIRVVSGYADLIVLRDSSAGIAQQLSRICPVPFINGGDGENEHPTQCLTDAFTLWRLIKKLDHLKIAVGFDIKNSRTIRSFVLLMSMYPENEFTFVCPNGLGPSTELTELLSVRGHKFSITNQIDGLKGADVIYVNRFQTERADKLNDTLARNRFVVTREVIGKDCIVLDPLPRVGEISEEVDSLPQAKYFEQSRFGVPIRMALLALMLGRAHLISQ